MTLTIARRTLLVTIASCAVLYAQGTPAGNVGWYNGDYQDTGTGGWSNWYLSETEYTRVFDEFTVPAGGWTVVGVFSNNLFNNAPTVSRASWQIRTGVGAGGGSAVIASGIGAATQTFDPVTRTYQIAVSGLKVDLAPGKYALSVTPVGLAYRQSYMCETTGGSRVGELGKAYYTGAPGTQLYAMVSTKTGADLHFSQGVLVSGTAPETTPLAPWQTNLASLAQQMARSYLLPFPGSSLAEFNASINELSAKVPTLSDAQIRTGMQTIVAAIGDPHTDISWGSTAFRWLPISVYWFDDGIYVISTVSQYRELAGTKLTKIGNTSIEDVIKKLTTLVPHENDSWVKHQLQNKYLINTDFLLGTGIIDNTELVPVTVENAAGEAISVTLDTSLRGLQVQAFEGDLPLYRQRPNRYYWATPIEENSTVYFQYNSCDQDPTQPSVEFFQELDRLLADERVQRLIMDMRNNTGGFVSVHNGFIDKIKASRFNLPGRLYVIVGRRTFSAAIDASDRFRDETAAVFVGEPSGGKPRFMIRSGDFALPFFTIRVSYSRGIRQTSDYGNTVMPDIVTGLTFRQYMAGQDPAVDAILKIPVSGK